MSEKKVIKAKATKAKSLKEEAKVVTTAKPKEKLAAKKVKVVEAEVSTVLPDKPKVKEKAKTVKKVKSDKVEHLVPVD